MDDILLNIFFAYSREDSSLRERLDKHLSGLKRKNFINTWFDGKIDAGKEWESEIDYNLSKADIILLLISADFIASDYCFNIEMTKAISRHENNDATIIPVILHPCDWSDLPFSKIQGLPQNGKPITSDFWTNSEIAFDDVAKSIKKIVEKLRIRKSKKLKSISEIIEIKENELIHLKNDFEDIKLEQEIKEESILKLERNIQELKSDEENLRISIKELENEFVENRNKYDKIFKTEQIEINKLRNDIDKLNIDKEKLFKTIEKLQLKKEKIEVDINRIIKK